MPWDRKRLLGYVETIQLILGVTDKHAYKDPSWEKPVLGITDWHLEACRVMTNGDHEGQIFLSHPHTTNESFFLLTTKNRIYYIERT